MLGSSTFRKELLVCGTNCSARNWCYYRQCFQELKLHNLFAHPTTSNKQQVNSKWGELMSITQYLVIWKWIFITRSRPSADILRLLLLILATSWFPARQQERGSMTPHCVLPSRCVSAPYTCICGMHVNSSGVHGLACRKSAGRHMRHNAINDLIKRALVSANVPSVLEPNLSTRDNGKILTVWLC